MSDFSPQTEIPRAADVSQPSAAVGTANAVNSVWAWPVSGRVAAVSPALALLWLGVFWALDS